MPQTTHRRNHITTSSRWTCPHAGSAIVALAALSSVLASAQAQLGVINEQAKVIAIPGVGGDNFGNSVGTDGSSFIVGARFGDGFATNSGTAYVYSQDASGAATQQVKLVALDGRASDGFGFSVAVGGNTAVVGSIFAGGSPGVFGAGAAYVFTRNPAGTWTQQSIIAPFDGTGTDLFGATLAMSGDTLAIGSNKDDDGCVGSPGNCNTGAVYVYTRNPASGAWTFQAKLHASDGVMGDRLGLSVAIDGNTIAAGSLNSAVGSLSGAGYVFVRDALGVWTQQAKIVPADGAANDFFGNTIAVNGDTVIGGANRHDDAALTDNGAAYVFTRDLTGVWTQQAKLLASDAAASDWFGWSVAVSGDRAIIGARLDDDLGADSGSAYVFTRDALGAWTEQNKLLASDGAAGDWVGSFAAISGQKVILGALKDDNANGVDAGGAYIFDFGIPADLNGDGLVNAADLAILLGQWGTAGSADLSADGLVNAADLAILLGSWG